MQYALKNCLKRPPEVVEKVKIVQFFVIWNVYNKNLRICVIEEFEKALYDLIRFAKKMELTILYLEKFRILTTIIENRKFRRFLQILAQFLSYSMSKNGMKVQQQPKLFSRRHFEKGIYTFTKTCLKMTPK